MRPMSAFLHLLSDSITYESAGSRDAYGNISFGTPTTYQARVVGEQLAVTSFEGREVTSRHTVYVAATIVAQPDDRITLSTDIVGSTDDTAIHPRILSAKRVPDQRGTHHTTLYLG